MTQAFKTLVTYMGYIANSRKGAYHIRVFNIEPSGVMTLVAKSKQELSKKVENRIFKKKGYKA